MKHKLLIKKLTILEKLATIDELTEVYNYRYFQEVLANEIYRAKRYDRDLSLMIVDLDNLKAINDTKGHTIGDKVIKGTAKILIDNIRKSNIVCRYGGDEFIIILPETNKKQTYTLAKRLRKLIKSKDCTVSIGLSSFPQDGKTLKGLFNSADRALYKAKQVKDTVSYEKEI